MKEKNRPIIEKSCCNCRFYHHKKVSNATGMGMGTCRFNPPVDGGFPGVLGTDWCGKHKKLEDLE